MHLNKGNKLGCNKDGGLRGDNLDILNRNKYVTLGEIVFSVFRP